MPPQANHTVYLADGSFDWSGGVDSTPVPTIQSALTPNGLPRNRLAWLINGTVRDAGITPRGGYNKISRISPGTHPYQGGFLYHPLTGDPYLIVMIGGRPYKVTMDGAAPVDIGNTAFQFPASSTPSITLQNLSYPAGGTVYPSAAQRSEYELPASFTAPAIGSALKILTSSGAGGAIGDILNFTGSFQVTSKAVTFNTTTLNWECALTIKNINCVPGQIINSNPQQVTGWSWPSFTSPAIGSTVNVTLTKSAAYLKIGGAVLYGANAWNPSGPNRFANLLVYSESLSWDGSNLVDTVQYSRQIDDTTVCGYTGTRLIISCSLILFTECTRLTDVTGWILTDAFDTAAIGTFGTFTVHQPATAPDSSAVDPGTELDWIFGSMKVTNIVGPLNPDRFQFGTSRCYFCQAEDFLVIQAGDNITLPLFWDGTVMRQSIGITTTTPGGYVPGVNEIPAAGPMDYYMGRLWYAQDNQFSAGDIVGGPSGTGAYSFRDSVLSVTENPLAIGGDGFATPQNEGLISALSHNASQDSALGQGRLIAFTPKGAHALSVPVTRSDWIASTSSNQPLLVPIQLANGTASDWSVVAMNGDLYYQSPQAELRSLITAVRNFGQYGNLPVSANESRLLKFTDTSLLGFGSGIYFNNRMYQTALPARANQGVVHQALYSMDLTPISSFGSTATPVWEGHQEGLSVLQVFTGIFSGQERAFAVVVSAEDGGIDLWEITKDGTFDNTDSNRITLCAEFPAFTHGKEMDLNELCGAEIWVDRVLGTCEFTLEFRPDGEACWQPWHKWKICSAKNTCEDLKNPVCYPSEPYPEGYASPMTLPKPVPKCANSAGRPSTIAFQFQPRLTVKGFCRIRGIVLYVTPVQRAMYDKISC